MIKKTHPRLILWLGWFFWAICYGVLIYPQLGKPIAGWGVLTWDMAARIASRGPAAVDFFYLPPLNASLIASSFNIFGLSEISARLPGVFCALFFPPLIYFLIKEITEEENRVQVVLIAATLFLTSPCVIQGTLLIDHPDGTFLTFALALFYLFLLKTEERSLRSRILPLGILYALCLWAKLTTPLACLGAVPLGYLLNREFKKGIVLSLGVFIFGGAFFLLTWLGYCYFFAGLNRFLEPLTYYAVAGHETLFALRPGTFRRILLDIFQVILWLSPFLLLLGVASFWQSFTQVPIDLRRKKARMLAVFAAVVFLGYGYANATFSGFPKYLIPGLPMLSCVCALEAGKKARIASDKSSFMYTLALICAGIIYYLFFVGDWLYPVYLLRQGLMSESLKGAVLSLVLQQLKYWIFPAALFGLSSYFKPAKISERLALTLFIALISSNIALGIIQRQAGYSVNYAYGTKGAKEVKEFLKKGAVRDVFTSIEGYIANTKDARFHNIAVGIWDDPKKLIEFLRETKAPCVLYGLASQSPSQLNNLLQDQTAISFLREHYRELAFGSYHLLLKK